MRQLCLRKLPVRLILALAGLVALFLCAPACLINKVVFHPTKGTDVSLQALGDGVEHGYIETSDHVRISTFYLERKEAPLTILFFHGNAGNASERLGEAEELRALGASVLLVDYRGFGLSEGRPTEKGIYLDAAASLAFLQNRKHTPPDHVVVYGHSLGTVPAVQLAGERFLAGVILVSPFTSGRDMVPAIFRPFIGHPFDSLRRIGNVKSPLLIMHGDQDDLVPIEMGRSLYERAKAEKRFVTIKGAGHNDLTAVNSARFFGEIKAFLACVAGKPY